MARVTEAQRIEQANEEAALVFFREALSSLPDPRRRQGVRYPLVSVVVIGLMAMVCGSDDAEAMDVWGEANAEWLEGILDLPHGTPTQDVFLSVFAALDPVAFRSVFLSWIELLRLGLRVTGKHIAVDGKTSRRSFDTGHDRPAIHTVSAWLSDEGLVLGQIKTADKSNEITAIPELLRVLDLRGATVTIDAMGCQTEIAKTIVDGKGNYLLSVKENQPALHKDLVATFAEAADDRVRSVDEHARPVVERFEHTDKGHGRIETRSIELCRDLDWMMSAERWTGLAFVAKVTRERTVLATNKTSIETAYYIGSDAHADAPGTAHRIRRHWSVENELHWVLDMAFREDEAMHRARHLAENLTTLRHFALNLFKRDPDRKLGVANSRRRAGWDHGYLLRVLTSEAAS
jgi:predicted transposase YbfD/YdcC